MIVMATRSSTTARVSRNERSADGRCVLITARTARAKAMSVAVGTAHPRSTSPPTGPTAREVTAKSTAGRATPHRAAAIGSAALAGSARSPTTNSRLSSTPATKKNTASSPSDAHCARLRSRCRAAGPTRRSRSAAYASFHGLLAQTMATTAATSSRMPPTVSVRRAAVTRWTSGQVERRRSRGRSGGVVTVWPSASGVDEQCRPGFPAHRSQFIGGRHTVAVMSNVATADLYAGCPDRESSPGLVLQRYDAIHAMISPRNEVLRLLPHRERRMVGAWCFADIYGPTDVRGQEGMSVPPHPHMGLQTVSWLVRGTVLHRDSLGTTALVEPGRVAVMTAGHGIAHSENSPPDHGPVFIGALGDVVSPAQGVTPLLGAELAPAAPGRRAGRLPLDPAYEHMLIPLAGEARVGRTVVETGQALYLGLQRDELDLALSADARVLLLGGVPFEEEIVMWWNLVGRTHEEIEQARRQWNGHGARFGEVSHYPGPERLSAPELPHVRLRPRGRVS